MVLSAIDTIERAETYFRQRERDSETVFERETATETLRTLRQLKDLLVGELPQPENEKDEIWDNL